MFFPVSLAATILLLLSLVGLTLRRHAFLGQVKTTTTKVPDMASRHYDAGPGGGESGTGTWNLTKQPRSMTLILTNLPKDVTLKSLLDRLTLLGPFGKLYSCHLHKTPTTRNPIFASRFPYAKIAFFLHKDTLLLRAFLQGPGILLHGYRIRAHITENPLDMVPEEDDPADDDLPNPSRVVLIKGPKFLLTREGLLSRIQHKGLLPYQRVLEIHDEETSTSTTEQRKFAILFPSYSLAKQAIPALRSPRNEVSAVYGTDPMDTGVRRELSRDGKVVIAYNNWNCS